MTPITPELIERVRVLRASGLTAADIARRIAAEHAVSADLEAAA